MPDLFPWVKSDLVWVACFKLKSSSVPPIEAILPLHLPDLVTVPDGFLLFRTWWCYPHSWTPLFCAPACPTMHASGRTDWSSFPLPHTPRCPIWPASRFEVQQIILLTYVLLLKISVSQLKRWLLQRHQRLWCQRWGWQNMSRSMSTVLRIRLRWKLFHMGLCSNLVRCHCFTCLPPDSLAALRRAKMSDKLRVHTHQAASFCTHQLLWREIHVTSTVSTCHALLFCSKRRHVHERLL